MLYDRGKGDSPKNRTQSLYHQIYEMTSTSESGAREGEGSERTVTSETAEELSPPTIRQNVCDDGNRDNVRCSDGHEDETIPGIRFIDYRDESQLDAVMRLVGRDLSEPYSSKWRG